jgi:tetraacyldisaccharide-1-P 4'-kinase
MRLAREDYEVLYPAGGSRFSRAPAAGSALSGILAPASLVYAGLSDVVRRVRSRGRRKPADAFLVSIGNIEVGGNGKTPFAAHLLAELARRGYRPAYASRGFKSVAEGLVGATVVVPRGAEPGGSLLAGTRILRADAPGLSEAVGDEGAMVASRCPDAPLAFSKDRRRAVAALAALFAPSHIVLDDAFQTWPLARDADIVLLDAWHPLGNGRILPAGSLREGAGALARADAVGFNGIADGPPGADGAEGWRTGIAGRIEELRDWTERAAGRVTPVFGIVRQLSFARPGVGLAAADSDGERSVPACLVAALSSVGRPRKFEESLARRGVTVGLALRYPDHYRYRGECVRRIDEALETRGIGVLVTTEKDWAKLREVGPPRAELRIARLQLEIVGDDPVLICEKPRGLPAAFA